ncbi:MlaD family protein [Nocardia bovistercoris]|uniref:MCE family protein n=1 Tax=Nocardia bovistercoris TaxID=2785916 RepID=A0A931IAS2_9NOCA|nr:MlaD family protein [Nocardia bovistercoris]MBH0776777.1 MCE family protein [Nocardia bovistercoris]
MNVRAITSLAAIAAVLVIGVAYMGLGVLHLDPRRSHISVRMYLENSGGLGPGAPVLLSGVQVGKTREVRKQAGGVAVELEIDDRYRIPVAGDIRIEQLSALGEPYISFRPDRPGGPYLENGQTVSTDRVHMPMTITALSTRLVELLKQVKPEVMTSLIGTFDQALSGTDTTMQTLERSTTLLAATLLSRTDRIRQLFDDLQALGGDISWMGPSLADAGPLFGEFGVTLSDIVQSSSALVEARPVPSYFTGDGLVPFLGEVEALLNKIGPSLSKIAPALGPVVAEVTRGGPALDVSTLIEQALGGVDPDGTLHFRVGVK